MATSTDTYRRPRWKQFQRATIDLSGLFHVPSSQALTAVSVPKEKEETRFLYTSLSVMDLIVLLTMTVTFI